METRVNGNGGKQEEREREGSTSKEREREGREKGEGGKKMGGKQGPFKSAARTRVRKCRTT